MLELSARDGLENDIGRSMSDRELRIVHVIRAKPPGEVGGADLHVVDLAEAQMAQGHEVLVICLGRAGITRSMRDRGIPHVEVDSKLMAHWVWALRALLRSDPPDVLHTHGYRADIVPTFAVRFIRGKHRWTSAMTVHGFIRTTVSLRIMTRIDECALRRAVSSGESRRLEALLRRRVHFIPNGVAQAYLLPRPEAMAKLGSHPSRRVVAFVGRLSPEKRPDLFVAMAGMVARKHSEVDFVVIGGGPLLDEVRDSSGPDPGNRVLFTGPIFNAASLMAAIDVLVCPSDSEGTPRVVIEAMLAGVPVVATRVGGIPDILDDRQTGIIIEHGSATALAAAVNALLSDRAEATAIGQRARDYALPRLSARLMEERTALAYWPSRSDPASNAATGGEGRRV
jgi:glycosyltransferase involved in cell wall biosynthesis